MDTMEDAKSILERYAGLLAQRAPWDAEWAQAAMFCMPRKGNVSQQNGHGPGGNAANKLYDTTAIESAAILASGHSSAITPAGTQWFAWEAPEDLKSDEADSWYKMASEKAVTFLSSTNFHTVLNECFEDRSGFGLCNFAPMPHKENVISFQAHPVGSFCCEEDAEGNVDTVFLRKFYPIRQLVQMFGEAAVMANAKLAKSWEKYMQKGVQTEHAVVHAVFPRMGYDVTKYLDPLEMPYASVWVAEDGKQVLLRSGMPEMAYCVSRYLKRTGSGEVYGYSPYEQVKAAIVDANRTKQILQVVGQKIAVPPVLIPDNLIGNVDLRPGGRTVFKANGSGVLPREWAHQGNPQGMMEQLEDARQAIRNAYHTDLFKMFSQITKQMTAREVAELSAEKLMPFSPSFTRFTSDFRVAMERIFAILFRAGLFGDWQKGEIPQAVVRVKGKVREVPPPKVIYQSRVALAIRQAESASADRLVERAMGVARMDPGAMDNIDLDMYIRMSGRNDGAPEGMLRPLKERDKMREARAAQEQQRAEMEQAAAAAEMGGKLGIKVPSDR